MHYFFQAARRIHLSDNEDDSDHKIYKIDRWARQHMHWDSHSEDKAHSSRHEARHDGDEDRADMPKPQLSLEKRSSSSSDDEDAELSKQTGHIELRQQDVAQSQQADSARQQQQFASLSSSDASAADDKARLLAKVRAGEEAYAKLNSQKPAAEQQQLAQVQQPAPEQMQMQSAAPQQQTPQYFETSSGQIVQLAPNSPAGSTQLAQSEQYYLTPSGQIVAEPAALQQPAENTALAQQPQMNIVPASESQSLSEDSEALDGSVGLVHADALEDPTMQPENSYTLTGTAYNQDVTMPAKYIPVNKVGIFLTCVVLFGMCARVYCAWVCESSEQLVCAYTSLECSSEACS
jgi:hypothetical protein